MPLRSADHYFRPCIDNMSTYPRVIDFPFRYYRNVNFRCDETNVSVSLIMRLRVVWYRIVSNYYGLIKCCYKPIHRIIGSGRDVSLRSSDCILGIEVIANYHMRQHIGRVFLKSNKIIIGGAPRTIMASPNASELHIYHTHLLDMIIRSSKTIVKYKDEHEVAMLDLEHDDERIYAGNCAAIRFFIRTHYKDITRSVYKHTDGVGHEFHEIVYD